MAKPRQPVKQSPGASLSWPGAIGLWLLLLVAGLLVATRDASSLILTLPDALFLLVFWGAVLLAGAGMAWPLLGLAGRPPAAGPLLWGLTCLLLGLWLLSLIMLILGVLGLMSPVIIGVLLLVSAAIGALGVYRGRMRLAEAWAKRSRPVAPGVLLAGGVLALSAGLWLAGAMRPPWFVGMPGDGYDVTLYHLQVPREYLLAGRIGQLRHNVYSYYPMQMEMLYLLGMKMAPGSGGQAMYQAKIVHGLLGCLTAGVLLCMFGRRRRRVGLWAALLLATCPMVLRLGWTAMVELGEFAYLALALAWLQRWWRAPRWQYALLIGLAMGASCCVKYLSVGFILAPILLVMALRVFAGHRRARLGQIGLAMTAAIVLFSPWLIRNLALTGNPLFPLATDLLGRGHWTPEEQKRWIQGHRPGDHPPVPQPSVPLPPRDESGRLGQFVGGLTDKLFNPALMVAGLLSAGWALLAWRRRRWSFPAALGLVLTAQLGVWALATHRMPPRFLSPALVVICLLAAEGIDAARQRLKAAPAAGMGASVVLCSIGLAIALWVFDTTARGPQGYVPPAPREDVARWTLPEIYGEGHLPPSGRLLMIGEAPAFYYPAGTVYSTPFDTQELLRYLKPEAGPAERLAHLRSKGISRILVNWSEIRRLATTYGYPEVLSNDVLEAAALGQPPRLGIIEELKPLGLRIEFDRISDQRPHDRRYATATLYALP